MTLASIEARGFLPRATAIAARTISTCYHPGFLPNHQPMIGLAIFAVTPDEDGGFHFHTEARALRGGELPDVLLDWLEPRMPADGALVSWDHWQSLASTLAALATQHPAISAAASQTGDRWRELGRSLTWHLKQVRAQGMPCLCTADDPVCIQQLPAALLPDPDITERTLIEEAVRGWATWARLFPDFDDAEHPANRALAAQQAWSAATFRWPPLVQGSFMNIHTNVPLHLRRSVSIRPVSAEGWQVVSGDRRFTHASAWASYLYIMREAGTDARGVIDFRHRGDLVSTGLELPAHHPIWARESGRIWREIDASAVGMPGDAIRCWHVVVTLPPRASQAEWAAMVRTYARDAIASQGPAVAWAIHTRPGVDGENVPPHAHLLITTRVWRHDSRHGQTVSSWCGPAMRARLHSAWLCNLPAEMRTAATTPYQYGGYEPAHPDCSAIVHMFDQQGTQPATTQRRIRRRPSHRLKKVRECPFREKGK